jgi:hypothetical protein
MPVLNAVNPEITTNELKIGLGATWAGYEFIRIQRYKRKPGYKIDFVIRYWSGKYRTIATDRAQNSDEIIQKINDRLYPLFKLSENDVEQIRKFCSTEIVETETKSEPKKSEPSLEEQLKSKRDYLLWLVFHRIDCYHSDEELYEMLIKAYERAGMHKRVEELKAVLEEEQEYIANRFAKLAEFFDEIDSGVM